MAINPMRHSWQELVMVVVVGSAGYNMEGKLSMIHTGPTVNP